MPSCATCRASSTLSERAPTHTQYTVAFRNDLWQFALGGEANGEELGRIIGCHRADLLLRNPAGQGGSTVELRAGAVGIFGLAAGVLRIVDCDSRCGGRRGERQDAPYDCRAERESR